MIPNIQAAGSDIQVRMHPVRKKDDMPKRILLLREVVELLMWELSAISNRKWEDLPELKKRKGILATRLRKYDWTVDPENPEPLDLVMLRSQIADLEYQSGQKIQVQLQMIRGQIDALQAEKQSWVGCINVYAKQLPEPVQAL
jgi:hypothetical protein